MTVPVPDGIDPSEEAAFDGRTLRIMEERLDVTKRRVPGATVRISTTTETVEETVEVELDRLRVEVTRVPVGRMIDEAPPARSEGDTTIVPVVEERFVVVKRLFLKEELHIRHVVERDRLRQPVTLRRQRAVVERREAIPDPDRVPREE